MSLGILAAGYLGSVLVSAIGLFRIGRRDLLGSLCLLPLYWMCAWIATMHAAFELIQRPHHWAKTQHVGLQQAGGGIPEPEPLGLRPQRKRLSKDLANLRAS
jgi:hypothetical protein